MYALQEPAGVLTCCLSQSGGPATRLTTSELLQLVVNIGAVLQETQP